jgi:hypothetical protein
LRIPRDQFHRGDPAIADIGDEGLAVGEGGLRTPEPEARRIGEVVDVGGTGGRGVEHAGAGQQVLQAHPGDALLRSLDLAARSFAASGIGHGVRFVEDDHAVEIFTGPGEDLVEPRCIVRPERRVG